MQSGLTKIAPDRHDYSLLHSFGALNTDPKGLPDCFSIYDGRPIPNQNEFDDRFTPAVRPIPYGCTGETTTFIAGLEDNALYPPDDFYFATPPGTDGQGRDIRAALATAKSRGFKLTNGTLGAKKGDYFSCYGAGAIDDFDAVRIALWINQAEKRGVSVGSWWYWGGLQNNALLPNGLLQTPSFKTAEAALHNHAVTGWHTITSSACACGKIQGNAAPGTMFLEDIPWCGENYGDKGIVYLQRTLYNKLMQQPWTSAFTLATLPNGSSTLPIGWAAIVDHLVYFIRNLFHA